MDGASRANPSQSIATGQACEVCHNPATTVIKVGQSRPYAACGSDVCHRELKQRARADSCKGC